MNDQFKYSLQQIAANNIPDDVNVWPAVQQRVSSRQARTVARRMLPTTRLGWATFAFMILLPVGLVLSSTLRDMYLQGDAALLYIEREGLNEHLDLQQTVNGFTFDLQRVYADANRIVIGYTVSGDLRETKNRQFSTSLDLLDADGNRIPGGAMTFDDEARDGIMEAVVSFDPSGMEQLPETLHAVIDLGRSEPTSDPGQWSGQKVASASFDFPLPARANTARRVVDVNQTVEANGIALTLEQIRVSPTTAVASVCGVDPAADKLTDWVTFGTLATKPNGSDQVEKDPSDMGSKTDCQKIRFYAPHFYTRGGKWTLMVTKLFGTDPVLWQAQEQAFAKANAEGRVLRQSPDTSRTITGPWTFRFTVPQP